MSRILGTVAVSILSLGLGVADASAAEAGVTAPPKGFVALFNGKDLSGWHGRGTENPRPWTALAPEELKQKQESTRADIRKHWSVEKGVLVNDGHGKYLTTDRDYGDFELLVDYKTVAKADSGIYLRGIPQVQIWDTTKAGGKWKLGADKGSGGLWNNAKGSPGKDPLVKADKPFGEWNRFRILMIGERVTVHFNDKLVVDNAPLRDYFAKGKTPVPARGPVQLQTHGGEIRWRNVFLREIPAEEANAILQKQDGEGFKTAFDGKTLNGWTGATSNYEVVDGTIRCKKGQGGNLFMKEEYADFSFRFEFKLPPGGNNGLGIRAPLQGNVAYSSMELQILDNTAPKYAKLQPYQYHGSIYGVKPAHRGYLRPVGEWNFQEVVAKGTHLQVILNGTRIIDEDLSKLEPQDGKKHPGLLRPSGYIGFAGHSDPVMFRNIRIKKLN
jgi:hypothetical protein